MFGLAISKGLMYKRLYAHKTHKEADTSPVYRANI